MPPMKKVVAFNFWLIYNSVGDEMEKQEISRDNQVVKSNFMVER